MKQRGLAMICANPDKIVKKGDRILYCAGKLAEMYAARGGEVVMAGKPFAPIYDLALAEARRITGRDIDRPDILAIGDGPETDIRGAADYGLDAASCCRRGDGCERGAARRRGGGAEGRAPCPHRRNRP